MERVIELQLDGTAHSGEAFGHYDGRVVFVPYAIQGERVRVELSEEKPRWARAHLLEVLEPSPDRVEPPCPYFGPGNCGGCQWQHIAYKRQALLKQEIVADQLRRLGHLPAPPVADIIALAAPPASQQEATTEIALLAYRYRNHTRFAVSSDDKLGYRRAFSDGVIPVASCLLLHELLDDLHGALDIAWPALTGLVLRAGINTRQALVVLETADSEEPELEIDMPAACALHTSQGIQPLIGEPWIEEQIAGRHYRVSAESFFRVNTIGVAALIEVVSAYLEPRPADRLLDVYCGVGLFGLALADSVGEVIGIESSPSACDDFAHNAGDREHVALHEGTAEAVLPVLGDLGQTAELVVMDPPRAGAGRAVVKYIADLRPRRIAYVSGDPATLARDSLYLVDVGYYLAHAQPLDLCPQTSDVETVALWERRTEPQSVKGEP